MDYPVFWKLSMGPGNGSDFPDLMEVLDWIRQGLVLVHKDTPAMGQSRNRQGDDFINIAQIGHYFYLCHGNEVPCVILLGQFTGPADVITPRVLAQQKGEGWAARSFRWIKTAIKTKKYIGEKKWWTPDARSTFVRIGPDQDELDLFESQVLIPFFDLRLSNLGFKRGS